VKSSEKNKVEMPKKGGRKERFIGGKNKERAFVDVTSLGIKFTQAE